MGHADSKITRPVATEDPAAVLAVASHNVAVLCASEKIRMWARFKPEATGDQTSLTIQQRRSNNFGLTPNATYTTKTAFTGAVRNNAFNGGWTYKRVSPYVFNNSGQVISGSGHWGRLDDFEGYNHNAVPPFGTLNAGTFMLTQTNSVSLVIPCAAPPDDESCINISEFEGSGADYKNWYFGILLFHTSRQFMATTTQPIGIVQDWQVNFGWINPSYAGTYKGVPFLSSKPFTNGGADPSDVKIIGVGSSGVEIKLTTTSQTYVPQASCYYRNATTKEVTYVASIQNMTTQTVTLTQVVLEVAKTSAGGSSRTLVAFGTITVQGGKTWTQSGAVAVESREYQFYRLRYNGATNLNWVNFEEPEADGSMYQ